VGGGKFPFALGLGFNNSLGGPASHIPYCHVLIYNEHALIYWLMWHVIKL
jgi:hypothetical protein